MTKAKIFNIKRYSVHDGPGLRTTIFLKGCSLSCQWCHSPEGIKKDSEFMFLPERCASTCDECITACKEGAISKKEGSVFINIEKCNFCGDCVNECVFDALQIVGRNVSIGEMRHEIEKDRIFFDESGGGVTFSGGEPLMQSDFLQTILPELKSGNIHTAIDTSGNVGYKDFEKINDSVDLYLYDLKIMDKKRHEVFTGESNKSILENLKKLSDAGKKVNIRIPLIKGVNDDKKNIIRTIEFLTILKNVEEINLLPYHSGGLGKFNRLGMKNQFEGFRAPLENRIEKIKGWFACSGLKAKIGG